MKEFVPFEIRAKDKSSKKINAGLWGWIFSWQWRRNCQGDTWSHMAKLFSPLGMNGFGIEFLGLVSLCKTETDNLPTQTPKAMAMIGAVVSSLGSNLKS